MSQQNTNTSREQQRLDAIRLARASDNNWRIVRNDLIRAEAAKERQEEEARVARAKRQ